MTEQTIKMIGANDQGQIMMAEAGSCVTIRATGQGGTLLGPVSFNVSVLGANVFLYLTLAEVAAVRDQCNKVVFELGSGRTT